ncbi:MAG: hypothetical protein ACI9DJ_003527 [Algoriphagus sp.]|jgi:hypothetical protein
MDFTLDKYKCLLNSLISQSFTFQIFKDFICNPHEKAIMLRHDVDVLPQNSLVFARNQAKNEIKGTYYFRAVPESWDERVIKEIYDLGHEVGYHYESLTTTKGNMVNGIKDFEKNLSALRKLVPVSTICMHGSPMSPYDSKDLWKHYRYQDFGIIGEPYFDIDFSKVFYLTDTGRRWDGDKVSVRDHVKNGFNLSFHSTDQIIEAAKMGDLPSRIMFTFHPQRWTNIPLLWTKELILQNLKNVLKRYYFVNR